MGKFMEYKTFGQLNQKVTIQEKKTVVVAAAQDPHVLEAVLRAWKQGLIEYVLAGNSKKIQEIGGTMGFDIPQKLIVETSADSEAAAASVRIIREGKGDFLMKGKLETAVLLKEVVNKETGIRTGSTMSHIAILEVPAYHKLLAITDGGMIPYPTLDQKKMILKNVVDLFHSLGYSSPKAAVLAASETVNDKMPETADARALKGMAKNGEFGDCFVEGPVSMDLIFSKESAEIKGYTSPIVDDADILLTPTIACGNILSKSMICLGGSKMAGCIAGARAPIVLTSRGSSAEEKYLSLMLCAAAVNSKYI
jgi:phosphate butyryltransferase